MTDREEKALNKCIAAAGWLNRAIVKYRKIPGFDLMSAEGNKALFQSSLAVRDAIKILRGYDEAANSH